MPKWLIDIKLRPDTEREFKELDFGPNPQKLQEEYLDI